jgi:uncharacterized membrane protein
METISLNAVLQVLICAGIIWVARTNIKNSERLVRIETILSGENGIVASLSGFRSWKHQAANEIQTAKGAAELIDLRVSRLEEAAQ